MLRSTIKKWVPSGLSGLLQSYGWFGLLQLSLDLILTRLLFREVRILRRPFRIRGLAWIQLGRDMTTGPGLRMDAFPPVGFTGKLIKIGRNVEINDHVHIAAVRSVVIGDETLIASRVFITDHNHGDLDGNAAENGPDIAPAKRPLSADSVIIGKRVWIGEGVMILPGVTIGDGAIVGGGAIVTRDIPAAAVAVGAPAHVIRQFDPETGSWIRMSIK